MTYFAPVDTAKKSPADYLLPAALRNFVRHRETGVVSVVCTSRSILLSTVKVVALVAQFRLFVFPDCEEQIGFCVVPPTV